ncbi:hypothetical protein HK096_006433 [Nowakowskiella sp. JEL0078]|nr:hypothetical protein HK096_006433 [Nowakowskiella sp. JEL0078]
MDAGIIHSLKAGYRIELVNRWLRQLEMKKSLTSPTLAEAVLMLNRSWQLIDVKTFKHCFAHTKILTQPQQDFLHCEIDLNKKPSDADINELAKLLNRFEIGNQEKIKMNAVADLHCTI